MTPALLLPVLLIPSVTVEFRLLPPGHDGLVEGVGRARYYLLDEYLELAKLDDELFMLRKDYDAVLEVGKSLRGVIDASKEESAACQKELDIMSDRSGRLLHKWSTCEARVQNCGGGYLPYAAGVIGGLLAIVGTTMILLSI